MSGVDQYDKLIPVFGTPGEMWPQMRLFLNMVKDNYEATNGSVRFAKKKYDEADAASYKDAVGNSGTVSSQFACFLNEFLYLVEGLTISPGNDYGRGVEGIGNFGERQEGKIVGSGFDLGIVNGSLPAATIVKALKDAEHQWFKSFMQAITTTNIANITDRFTFKTRREIITDLDIQNLFTGLQGSVWGDRRSTAGTVGTPGGRNAQTSIAMGSALRSPSESARQADQFLQSFVGGDTPDTCLRFAGAGVPISYKWDKYVLGHLLKSAVKSTSTATSNFFKNVGSNNAPIEDAYYRKVGDDKNLYALVNGKETAVQIGSAEAKKIKMGQHCFNLGLKSTNTGEQNSCYNLVKECLAGNDIATCKTFMTTNTYWTSVKQDVDTINLDLAKQLLESFGFPIKSENSQEAGMTLNFFGNSTEWLTQLKESKFGTTTFTDTELRNIGGNVNLIGYLDAIAAKVNRNPGVLNPDYNKDGPNNNSRAFAGNNLTSFGLQGKFVRQGSGVPSVSSIIALQNVIMSKRNALSIYYGIPLNTIGFGNMRGGGAATAQFDDMKNNNILPLRLSQVIEQHYNYFLNSLKQSNKDLDQTDKDQISNLIVDLKKVEEKLFKAAIYTSKYQDLVSVFGQEDTNNLITLDHLQEFVDKRNSYFTRTGKQQDVITSILKALADATQKESSGVSVSASKYDLSPKK